MAIVVEDNRQSSTGVLGVFIWVVLLCVVGAAVYYVFFKKPELITVAPPKNFKEAQDVAKIQLDAAPVVRKLNLPYFDSHITIPPAAPAGRSNPFLSL
jgi:hypothetical protein